MSTPLELLNEWELEFDQWEEWVFYKRHTERLLQALHDELEGKKKVEKQIHTPNCMRGTSTTGHSYCSMSEEDEGYNQAIMEITTELDELMSRIATG